MARNIRLIIQNTDSNKQESKSCRQTIERQTHYIPEKSLNYILYIPKKKLKTLCVSYQKFRNNKRNTNPTMVSLMDLVGLRNPEKLPSLSWGNYF